MPKEGCKRISFSERKDIEKLLKDGWRVVDIAKKMNRSHQSIYREIKRGGSCSAYNAEYAQQNYAKRNAGNGRKPLLEIDKELAQYISKLILEDSLSPVEILKRLRAENYPDVPLSRNTIYYAIYNGLIPSVSRDTLLQKHKTKKTHMFSNGLIKIPKWICKELNLQDNEDLDIDVIDGTVVIKKSIG